MSCQPSLGLALGRWGPVVSCCWLQEGGQEVGRDGGCGEGCMWIVRMHMCRETGGCRHFCKGVPIRTRQQPLSSPPESSWRCVAVPRVFFPL